MDQEIESRKPKPNEPKQSHGEIPFLGLPRQSIQALLYLTGRGKPLQLSLDMLDSVYFFIR